MIVKKMWSDKAFPRSSLALKARQAADQNRIIRKITGCNTPLANNFDQYSISEQISRFKKIKKELGFTNQKDRYFGKVSITLRPIE